MMRNSRLQIVQLVAATPIVALSPFPGRSAILFSPPSDPAFVVTLAPTPSMTAGQGLVLSQATGPILLRVEDFGSLVQSGWWALSSVATTITALEALEGVSR